jgi:MFS family permease
MFYVPVLFSSLGSGHEASLLNAVIIGCFNVLATLVAIFTVDKLGRRTLLLEGGIQMCVSMIITAVVLGVEFSTYNTSNLPSGVAIGVLVVIIVFVTGFAWSWGPLGWLVPSEIQTMETRAAGMASAVMINFLFSFVIGQCFLSMLCAFEWAVFLFFAGFVVLMTLFVFFLLPETKGIPIERVQAKFAKHRLWSRLMGPAAAEIIARDKEQIAEKRAAQDANKVEAVKEAGPDTVVDAAADLAKTS